MGLFGGKDDTKAKIDELKAKMQGGQAPPQQDWQPPQQPWQQQAPPPQQWQPPQEPQQQQPAQQQPELPRHTPPPREPVRHEPHHDPYDDSEEVGIVLDLGEGMSLNLPIRSYMRLDEFLRIADRVRELKKIDSPKY